MSDTEESPPYRQQLVAERTMDLERFSFMTHHPEAFAQWCLQLAEEILKRLVESGETFRIEGAHVSMRVVADVDFQAPPRAEVLKPLAVGPAPPPLRGRQPVPPAEIVIEP